MLHVAPFVLAGQHQHFHGGIEGKQFTDQGETLARPVGLRGQPKVDQRQLWRRRDVAQQSARLAAVAGTDYLEFIAQREAERLDYQLVIIDQQQHGALW